MKEIIMIKQKIQTFLLIFIPFGLSGSFTACFFEKQQWPAFAVLAAGLAGAAVCACFSEIRKTVFEAVLKVQPLAAVVFAASFILSFQPCRMLPAQLFAVLILNAVCVCAAFERQKSFNNKISFALAVFTAAAAGGALAFALSSRAVYTGFVLAALCCRPASPDRTPQDIWQDIAFPMFVLVCSFLLFIAASHLDGFAVSTAEAAVMVMTGALLISSRESGLRLMLMTAVVIVFGSYVFSARNSDSVFNRTGRIQSVVERSV